MAGGPHYYQVRMHTHSDKSNGSEQDFQRMIDAKAIERIRLHHMRNTRIDFRLREAEPTEYSKKIMPNETVAAVFHKRKNVQELTFLEKDVIPANLELLAMQGIKRIVIQSDSSYHRFLLQNNPSLSDCIELDNIEDSAAAKGLMYDRVAARLNLVAKWREPNKSLRKGCTDNSRCILFIDSDLFLNTNRLLAALALFGRHPQCYLFYTSSDWQWGINEGLIAFTSSCQQELVATAYQFLSLIEKIYNSAAVDKRIQAAWPNPFNWRCGQAILNAMLPKETAVSYGDILKMEGITIRLLPGHLYNHIFTPIYNDFYQYAAAYIPSIHLTGVDKKPLMPLAQHMSASWGQC
jgi:hypothetical protein